MFSVVHKAKQISISNWLYRGQMRLVSCNCSQLITINVGKHAWIIKISIISHFQLKLLIQLGFLYFAMQETLLILHFQLGTKAGSNLTIKRSDYYATMYDLVISIFCLMRTEQAQHLGYNNVETSNHSSVPISAELCSKSFNCSWQSSNQHNLHIPLRVVLVGIANFVILLTTTLTRNLLHINLTWQLLIESNSDQL